ncbi:MAG: amino acid racemase [Bacteroidales bacterium]|nr:amino acid racemase [Lachnoclostridium sp.]MCM1383747.1 amino acid racemase [Lachnoclostridium sp.]MCM1464375.1 amino acid racemase [Bacteroidales bacterium]
MKKLGVIGGLGPMATAYFLQLVIQMSDAKTDQEHIETIIHSRPQIPDRTRYILGLSGDNPMPLMVQTGKGLVGQGAEVIAIPCITAHFFQKQLEKEIGVPIVNAIEETALQLEAAGIDKAGILATDGTIQSGLFQETLEKHEIRCILPDEKGQKQVMRLIYEDIKSGNPIELSLFKEVSGQLFRKGAQAVLLACTELSLIKRDYGVGAGFLDVMEVLARKSVLSCGRLKKEYEQLVTK